MLVLILIAFTISFVVTVWATQSLIDWAKKKFNLKIFTKKIINVMINKGGLYEKNNIINTNDVSYYCKCRC